MERDDDERSAAIAAWKALLGDSAALLENPGLRHKFLLQEAHTLFRAQIITPEDRGDMLDLADGALAYAIEAHYG